MTSMKMTTSKKVSTKKHLTIVKNLGYNIGYIFKWKINWGTTAISLVVAAVFLYNKEDGTFGPG
jgi:hypothetical protein